MRSFNNVVPAKTDRAGAAPEGGRGAQPTAAQSPLSLRLATRYPGGSVGGGGRPLPSDVRGRFESSLGTPLGDVRLHTGRAAARVTRDLGARAFTAGRDIYFGSGAYTPGGVPDGRILAHEVAHAAQHARPVGASWRGTSARTSPWLIGRPNDAAEREAVVAASALLMGRPARITPERSAVHIVRRFPDDEPPEGAGAPTTLTNARFAGDRILQRILTGQIAALSSAHNGRRGPVSKVQQALVDLGFELPMHLVDGSYGAETEEALRQFRAHHNLPTGNQLDGTTLAVLDRVAPPPGERREQTVDYDRLLADNRLDITVAIGYSDTNVLRQTGPRRYEDTGRPTEALMADRFREWLTAQTFRLELLGWASNEYWKATRTITWTARDGTQQSREIAIWVNLIEPGAGAAREFREGLSSDEITIYAGHARYGSGPDFDAKASPDENFRIGIDHAMRAAGRRTTVEEARRHGVAIDEEHDLLEMVNSGDFDANRYRVLFFEACTSLAYLDEIREHIGGPETTDVIATRRPSLFTTLESAVGVPEVQRFLEGVLNAESVQSIVAALNEIQRQRHGSTPFPTGGIYGTSGFGDNPTAP